MPRSPTRTTRDRPNRWLEFLHLVGNCGGVSGIAWIDVDRHGAAVAVGQQAVDDDRQSLLAIAVVTQSGQRAGVSFVVTAADVIEHQRAVMR